MNKTSIGNDEKVIWQQLATIPDPEIPVVSIVDLGMIRGITVDNGQVIVQLAPTYNGCPALEVIRMQIRAVLEQALRKNVEVQLIIDPPWTTDWISKEGLHKLKEYGIAPPAGRKSTTGWRDDAANVSCPHCGSNSTELISQFGSTPCKALYRCTECLEPFDYFKCH